MKTPFRGEMRCPQRADAATTRHGHAISRLRAEARAAFMMFVTAACLYVFLSTTAHGQEVSARLLVSAYVPDRCQISLPWQTTRNQPRRTTTPELPQVVCQHSQRILIERGHSRQIVLATSTGTLVSALNSHGHPGTSFSDPAHGNPDARPQRVSIHF